MSDEGSSRLHIDSDWKTEAALEKERLAKDTAGESVAAGGVPGQPVFTDLINMLAMQAARETPSWQAPCYNQRATEVLRGQSYDPQWEYWVPHAPEWSREGPVCLCRKSILPRGGSLLDSTPLHGNIGRGIVMSEIALSVVKNAVVGLFLALVIALIIPGIKLIVVDALLGSGPKMPLIGIRWGLPEFIIGSIVGGLIAKVVWKAVVADFVKALFNIG